MIHVANYGVGNVKSLLYALARVGVEGVAVTNPDDLRDATHIILPGVGNFDTVMKSLEDTGFKDVLVEKVQSPETYLLGICVGMQVLADESEEGSLAGLGLISGHVRSLKSNVRSKILRRIPQIGWNRLKLVKDSDLLSGIISEKDEAYFLHSYFFEASGRDDVLCVANQGFEIDVVVSRGNIFGVQFHPEKSYAVGEKLLKNFSRMGL